MEEEEGSLLLSQSLLQWNSAQFSSSLETLARGTTAFLDFASQTSASAEVNYFLDSVCQTLDSLEVKICVVDPNTLNLDPDPGFWSNLDPDPCFCHHF